MLEKEIKRIVGVLWSLEKNAEVMRKVFKEISKDCDCRTKDACTHTRNPCKVCNHCNCGFAVSPLSVM